MKKLIFGLLLAGTIAACGKPAKKENDFIDKLSLQQIAFGADETYQYAIDTDRKLSSGGLNFVFASPEFVSMKVESVYSSLVGCDDAEVKVGWFKDASSGSGNSLYTGTTFTNTPGVEAKLQAQFLGVENCTQITFSIKLKRLSSVNPLVAATFPQNYLGEWLWEDKYGQTLSAFNLKFEKDYSGPRINVTYYHSCNGSGEIANGVVASVSGQKISIKITNVSYPYAGGCLQNILGLKSDSVGKYINCLGERHTPPYFRVACNLTSDPNAFPPSFENATARFEK